MSVKEGPCHFRQRLSETVIAHQQILTFGVRWVKLGCRRGALCLQGSENASRRAARQLRKSDRERCDLGVGRQDTEADANYMAEKIAGLRIFEDELGKMNRSVTDVSGSVLAVSQFTLYGDVRRGKRPSFDDAAHPDVARKLYEYFVGRIRATGLRCETGQFQAMMKVELLNDGPVTILLDSTKAF
jgi:D-tyrosyl-tRNA(Tyr) deacylase